MDGRQKRGLFHDGLQCHSDLVLAHWLPSCCERQVDAAHLQLSHQRANPLGVFLYPNTRWPFLWRYVGGGRGGGVGWGRGRGWICKFSGSRSLDTGEVKALSCQIFFLIVVWEGCPLRTVSVKRPPFWWDFLSNSQLHLRIGCGWTLLLQGITSLLLVTSLSIPRPRTTLTAWSSGW